MAAKQEEKKEVKEVKTDSAKTEAVKMAMAQIERQFGKGAIMKMGDRVVEKIPAIPTGAISLDLALGIGGIPKGRIVEIYGPESSGKTTLALHILAESQKMGGTAAYIDAEHALDPQYAKNIGVNIDDMLLSQPDNGEQALEIVETLIRSGAVDLIVVDSVAALTPRAEIEGEMGDAVMGMQARLMSQAMRKLTAIIGKSGCTVIFINQIRMKIGVMFGNPETTTGGNALKFYASVRMDIRKKDKISEGEVVHGQQAHVKIVKNKVAPPFKEADFDIIYPYGISKESSLLETAVTLGIIQKAGAWFKMGDRQLAQGREAVKQLLHDEKPLYTQIEKQIREKMK
jgi:recombination protein RecA